MDEDDPKRYIEDDDVTMEEVKQRENDTSSSTTTTTPDVNVESDPMEDDDVNSEGSVTADNTKETDVGLMEEEMKRRETDPTTMTDPEVEFKKMATTTKKLDTAETAASTTSTMQSVANYVVSSSSLSLHDCLSLGEINLGLEKRYEVNDTDDNNNNNNNNNNNDDQQQKKQYLRSVEEIRRLPYLLRILSRTRPLASIQSFTTMKKSNSKTDDDDNDEEGETTSVKSNENTNKDDDVDRLVDCLEDVTATYSVAEGIDVITNHLAPSVAKTLSRLPPLIWKSNNNSTSSSNINNNEDGYAYVADDDFAHGYWDTEDLASIARDPISKRRRRSKNSSSSNKKIKLGHGEKNESEGGGGDNTGTSGDDLVTLSTDDDGEEDIAMTSAIEIEDDTVAGAGRRFSLHRRDSMKVAAEDSQESTVIKTLSELASLVVASLEPSSPLDAPNQEEDNHHKHRQDVKGEGEGEDDQQQRHSRSERRASSTLALNSDDSILSEKKAGNSGVSSKNNGNFPVGAAETGGVMEGNSDLCSTIVAIMHHAPILQSRHVANSFCRASVPQTGDLMSQLAANCPASVQSLLLGCIEAYTMSIQYHNQLGDRDDDNNKGYSINNGKISSSSCTVVAAAKVGVVALARLSATESARVRSKLQSLGVMLDVQMKLAVETATNDIVPVACLLMEHMSFPKQHETAIATIIEEQPSGDTDTTDDFALNYAMACSEGAEPSLLFHFVKNPDLYTQTLDYFSETMNLGATLPSGSSINKSTGKWILVLKAYILLMLVPLTRSSSSSSTLRAAYKSSVKAFEELLRSLDCGSDKGRPEKSDMDTLVSVVLSCAALLISRALVITEGGGTKDEENMTYIRMMQNIFKICRSTSEKSNMIRLSFESEMKKEDHWGLFKSALYPVETISHMEERDTRNSYHSMQIGLNRFCDIMQPVLGGKEGEVELNIAYRIATQLRALRSCSESASEYLVVVEETKGVLDHLLGMDNEIDALSLMDNIESVQFVMEATRFLVKAKSSEVPSVLPTHLDMAWSKIASRWMLSDTKSIDDHKCIFLFRFLYAFVFLDIVPKSPFAFDPRSSPIKESLAMVKKLSSKSTRDYLLSELQILIQKYCPELVFNQSEQELDLWVSPPFDTMDRKSLLDALSNSIQANLYTDNAKICENNATEQLFLHAKGRVCDASVYCTVTNAFLSSPDNPPPNFSYHLLCRDPLVCLKFPLFVWKCKSLRRIALSVLETLLRSNDAITLEESKIHDSALELLVARDVVVVRCLLAALHGGDSKNTIFCSMTTSFIRWLIRSRSGLVALLVKQGIQERDLDWLVENVPETMNDSRYLLQIFSERNSLTSAERLTASDACIRIAIVHGQSNETEAAQLIVNAVSQLVDSFYLILGPVGLFPVDALFNAESGSGTPITQLSQKAAFRILKSLTKVRGIRTHNTRRECGMVLQKLINLCKGELQGGAVTGRRKQLLKELYDAATKAEK
jgi:hypothetical protein